MSEEPWIWIRENFPEAKDREDELFDLFDVLKGVWKDSKQYRINLTFAVEMTKTNSADLSIHDHRELQRIQNSHNSTLVFIIDLMGNIMKRVDIGQEVIPSVVMHLSQKHEQLMVWLGPDFEIYYKGYRWEPRNKQQILADVKSKQRDRLFPMEDYRSVLDTHYERCIRGQASVDYWFPGKTNQVLRDVPERLFQKSLVAFLNQEVDCISADPEPMFRDRSRCDVRVFVENYDLYFIEIKWIGYAARRLKGEPTVTAVDPMEFGVDRAIDGAYQTKLYIERNNSPEFDHRIRLGIYLVYDAYPEPATPIDYGPDIRSCPLLEPVEYRLVTEAPSVETKGIARRKGLL